MKANAYGLGARHVCAALTECHRFAVATADEAKEVRSVRPDCEVLILGEVPPSDIGTAAECGAIIAVGSLQSLTAVSDTATGADIAVLIDTGMHRDGVDCRDIDTVMRFFDAPGVKVRYVFSHLRGGEDEVQSARLYSLCDELSRRGYDVPYSLPATYGAGHCRGIPRIGIGLYGIGRDMPEGVKCAVGWRARIGRIAEVEHGEFIGYGHTYRAAGKMRIATVSAGYADGIFRSLSNAGHVLIGGKRCPIVGTVCMDMMTADVTDTECAVGDAATVIGTDGGETLTFAQVADTAGTIEYEISARIGTRVPRIYE